MITDEPFEELGNDDRQALTALCMEYVWRIDYGRAADVWTLFTEDGSCELPWGVMTGHGQLREAWSRRASEPLITRHMISNLHFLKMGENRVGGTVSLTLYIGRHGEKLTATPAIVGEHIDIYRQISGGRWRFHSRRFQSAFSSLGELPIFKISPTK